MQLDHQIPDSVGLRPLLTTEDMEAIFRVTSRTLSRWCRAGRIPKPAKLGGLNRWRAEDLSKFIGGFPNGVVPQNN
jgi:predicted site-specific integrase-resolvase